MSFFSAADHLKAWFTPARRALLSLRAIDLAAGSTPGTLNRFLNGEKYMNFNRVGISRYLAVLALLGYVPHSDTCGAAYVEPCPVIAPNSAV